MVFPSRGCQTCRTRRVKCDTVQPSCGRCNKAGRTCTWDPNVLAGQEGLLFKSENAFAQGRPRRPRGAKEPSPELSPPDIPSAFSTPIAVQAFHYWMENFMFRLDDLPDIGHEYRSYVLLYWNRALPDSSLHLALSALSHAVFGRARHVSKAVEEAERIHAQTIISTKKDMDKVSNESIDQLLLAIMLMGTYENTMYKSKSNVTEKSPSGVDDVGSQFWKDVCHHKGASGLLKLRRQEGYTPNLPLDRAIRRQLIRTIILRGTTIPDWLLEGAEYGEESPALEVDSFMVRVANLRAKSLIVFSGKDAEGLVDPHQLKTVAGEADELDIALTSWSQSVPEGWTFSTQGSPPTPSSLDSPESEQLFEGTSHIYTSHGHAVVWNRYRAVRLIVNSICLRSLSKLLEFAATIPQCDPRLKSHLPLVFSQQEKCRKNLESLATDLCGSVPSFFSTPSANEGGAGLEPMGIGNHVVSIEIEILPKMAALMAWPVAVAIRTEGVPEPQRAWLKCRLKVAAESMGDAMLETVIENGEFKF